MGDGHFFSVQPLSAVAEAPRPFGFLVSGARAQGLFLRRHLAAVAHGEGVLYVVGAFYAPVFELDVDGARFEQDSLIRNGKYYTKERIAVFKKVQQPRDSI